MRTLSLNERRLIELVATKGPIARTDIANELALTGAAITRLVGNLDQMDLFVETKDRQGFEGQPKRLLALKPGQYYSAGLIFSLQYFELALLDLAGEVIDHTFVLTDGRDLLELAKAAKDQLFKMIADHGLDSDRLVGLGCAMPINFGRGGQSVVAHGNFKELEDGDSFKAFLQAFELPIWFENDGTTSAIGEYLYGRQTDDGESLFLLHLGSGVGGGAVINGVPFYGTNGNACLSGFFYPDDLPRPSGDDLLTTLFNAGCNVQDFNDLEKLVGQCPVLDAWVERAGSQLVQSVLAASGFIEPSVIVIGGRLPKQINEALVAQIRRSITRGPSVGLSVAPMRPSSLGQEAGTIGAACLPLFDTFFGGQAKTYGSRYLDGRRRSFHDGANGGRVFIKSNH